MSNCDPADRPITLNQSVLAPASNGMMPQQEGLILCNGSFAGSNNKQVTGTPFTVPSGYVFILEAFHLIVNPPIIQADTPGSTLCMFPSGTSPVAFQDNAGFVALQSVGFIISADTSFGGGVGQQNVNSGWNFRTKVPAGFSIAPVLFSNTGVAYAGTFQLLGTLLKDENYRKNKGALII